MATPALGISGRLEEGESLQAWVLGAVTGLQWQAWVNGSWVNVGPANSQTYTIPAGAAGTAYRLAGSSADGTFYSEPTGAAVVDTRKSTAPVFTGEALGGLATEGGGEISLFHWLTFSDGDKGNYGGGSLILQNSNSLLHGGDGEDVLSIRFGGTQAGQFSYNAATREVRYAFTNGNAVTVGTIDAALDGNGTDLKVAFNTNATAAVVNALTDNLQFRNDDDSPAAARLFTLRVTDPGGASAQRVTSVSIENTPDAPVFVSGAGASVDENQVDALTVAAIDPDREAGDPQGIGYSLAAGAGDTDNARFEIDAATGALRFTAAPDYEDAQHGPAYSVRVRATDSDGSAADQVITVTVRDVNEAPVASDLAVAAQEDGPATRFDAAYSDPDAGDSTILTFDTTGTVGTVSLDGRTFTYSAAGRFEQLPAYMSANDTFTYTVTDAAGLATTRTVTVVVQGNNDAAAITGNPAGSVREDTAIDFMGRLSTAGKLDVTDTDAGEAWFHPALATGSANLGTFNASTDGSWTYSVDNTRVQYLAAGETVVDTYTVRSFDGSATQQLQVTISGVNDAPVIDSSQGVTGTVVESGVDDGGPVPGVQVATGALAATDIDGDTLGWSSIAYGQYGTLYMESSTGEWSYVLDDSSVDWLGRGDTATDTLTVGVSDNNGGSASQAITITIQGTNDAPQILAGDIQGTVTESSPDGTLVLDPRIAGNIQDIATDADGHMLIVGSADPYSWGRSLWRLNEDGSLDTSFGDAGGVYMESGAAFDNVAVDSAGRYVVGGQVDNPGSGSADAGLARYLQDGNLDTSFGAGGVVMIDYGGGSDSTTRILAQANGDLLVVGDVQPDPQGSMQLGLTRLGADGSLDAGFGSGGKLVFTLPQGATGGFQAAVDPQGRIVVWGTLYAASGENPGPSVYMARLLSDGTTDTGFGNQGLVEFSLGSWYANRAGAIALDDGGITLGWGAYTSEAGYHVNLTRFDTNGAVDAGFGDAGTVVTGVATRYGSAFSMALDAQGKLVVAPSGGYSGTDTLQDFEAARFNADGSVDATFGAGGVSTTDLGGDDYAEHLLLGSDGSILLAGRSNGTGVESAALVRYQPGGGLDANFGGRPDAQVGGWLQAIDVDGTTSPHWSGSADGVYGEFSLDAYGMWSYRLDNSRAATQQLAEGQTVTETFLATATDGYGATATQEVVITVVGSYDPPAP